MVNFESSLSSNYSLSEICFSVYSLFYMFVFIMLISIWFSEEVIADEKLKSEKPIPILAWIGPPENETTVQRYKEMADAGFTHSFSFFNSVEAMEKAINVAHATKIKMFVYCPELKKNPEDVVKKFMKHPALEGYHIIDEPSAKQFPELAAWVKRIQALDKNHWCYINLFPNYASLGALGTNSYQEHVDRFIAEVPSEIISFDHYPIIGNTVRSQFYENLEIISNSCNKAKKPFWGFTLSVQHASFPMPLIEHMRLQVFCNLAYGASGIQYFTYWTPPKYDAYVFEHAPIELDGKKSPVYELAKTLNKEIQGLSGVFMDSKVISLGHTGNLPIGTKAFEAIAPIESLKTEGNGAVVSLLAQKDRRFLVVVNRDILATMPLKVTFDANAKMSKVDKTGNIVPINGKDLNVTVDKGDIVVLTWLTK